MRRKIGTVNKISGVNDELKETKTGQTAAVSKVDVINFEKYAGMSEDELAKMADERNDKRLSTTGATLNTYVPKEFKNKYPHMHFEWVYENLAVIEQMKTAGWVVVQDLNLAKAKSASTGSSVKISAMTTKDGKAEYLVLMAIPKRFKEDDLKARKKKMKELMDLIETGKLIDESGNAISDQEGFYHKDMISIS